MTAIMERLIMKEDPDLLQVLENMEEENRLNVDEYRKIKKPPTMLQSFYAGKSIFLTGATGFMGKCFVEKILRDCPDLKKLYVLVRTKAGVGLTAQEKMKKYFSDIIFDRLRKIDPNFESKVVTIRGDLYERNLGLSAKDRQLLIDNVDVMVHNGATVRFNDPVRIVLKINVLGTRDMLELAMACKHMRAFMYVSTAYSHCYLTHIEEKFYKPPADLKVVHDMIAADEATKFGMPRKDLKKFLGKWANIYTFSKSISEDLVRQYGERASFACGVHRPSMVFGAVAEPRIGWIGNRSGPIAGFIAGALGAVHGCYYQDAPLDIVPVDYSINSLIAAIYHSAKEWLQFVHLEKMRGCQYTDIPQNPEKNVTAIFALCIMEVEKKSRVYNFGTSVVNPMFMALFYQDLVKFAPSLGSVYSVWVPSVMFIRQKWLYYMVHFFLHFIPAIFADMALLLMGKKPRALSIFWRVTENLNWITHFISYGWRIYVTETRKVYDCLSEEDRRLFNFDIWRLSWKKYSAVTIVGTRVYGIKEPLSNRRVARRHYFRLQILHYVTLTIFYLVLLFYVIRFCKFVNNAFS